VGCSERSEYAKEGVNLWRARESSPPISTLCQCRVSGALQDRMLRVIVIMTPAFAPSLMKSFGVIVSLPDHRRKPTRWQYCGRRRSPALCHYIDMAIGESVYQLGGLMTYNRGYGRHWNPYVRGIANFLRTAGRESGVASKRTSCQRCTVKCTLVTQTGNYCRKHTVSSVVSNSDLPLAPTSRYNNNFI
jgi:hypothetical protein